MKSLTSIGLLAFLILSGGVTQAALIQYQISGTVYGIVDPGHELDGIVQLGTPYTGTWVFDTKVPDSNPVAFRGQYEGVSASLAVSGITVDKGGALEVRNETGHDALVFNSRDPGISFTASLADPAGALLSSDALPLQIPDFPDRYVQVFWDPAPGKFSASIDSITVSSIPEPGALSLLFFGLVGVRQRRGRHI